MSKEQVYKGPVWDAIRTKIAKVLAEKSWAEIIAFFTSLFMPKTVPVFGASDDELLAEIRAEVAELDPAELQGCICECVEEYAPAKG